MRFRRGHLLAAVGLASLVMAGCQRINQERTIHLESGDVQAIIVDPPSNEQKIMVKITSGSPIDAYVVLERDLQTAKQALLDSRSVKTALASKQKDQNPTLEATIPSRNGFAILLAGARKSTEAKVKITSQ
jgi:hypothetical protein